MAIPSAAILLCLPHWASAQSSVTLYGVLDASLLYTSRNVGAVPGQNAGKQFSIIDSGQAPSQFGLRGTEDIGGGLKAQFALESGISVANGGFNSSNGNLFGRQAWIGLDGAFGNAKFGLQYSPFFLTLYDLDPRGLSLFGSSLLPYVGAVAATGVFNTNALSYTSPTIAGFQGSVMFAPGGVPGDFRAGRQYSASLKYDNGSLLAEASIYDSNAGGVQTPVPSDTQFEGRMLGAGYRFGKLTVKASFVNYKVAGSFNSNVYGGGVDYVLTPSIDLNGGAWYSKDRNNSNNHSLLGALGANYFLSKATTLYTQVAIVNNHGAMNTGLATNGGTAVAPGTTTGVNIGIKHTF
ncbi:porin [Burkholderia sp. Ac-20345]|uniref:porin n=1 Tax=Burkholderia sp. Ac-20345 TaxID=2703891 RepID=UPI003217D718